MTIPNITSPAITIDSALALLFKADTGAGGLAPLMSGSVRVYSLRAPQDVAPPYIVLGTTNEIDFSTFGQHGHEDAIELHIWTPNPEDKSHGLSIYSRLSQLLDKKKLVLTGHRALIGTLTLVAQFPDEDNETLHTVATYRVLSYFAA